MAHLMYLVLLLPAACPWPAAGLVGPAKLVEHGGVAAAGKLQPPGEEEAPAQTWPASLRLTQGATLFDSQGREVVLSQGDSVSAKRRPTSGNQKRSAFVQSIFIVGVAELFDKTWFMALLCALSFGRKVAFWASFSALGLHTLIAAMLGAFISKFFKVSLLHFITAGVFALLAALYAHEWVKAEPTCNALEERSEEAKDSLQPDSKEGGIGPNGGDGDLKSKRMWVLFLRCFSAVFAAEWGDRTQIAMISLHSSLPLVPVCLGSLVAFLALTVSAVLAASLLEGQQLSERLICGVSALSFMVFALLAAVDGMRDLRSEKLS